MRARPSKTLQRSEGRKNHGYGPQPGAKRSIVTLHRNLLKRQIKEAEKTTLASERALVEGMTRDELRSVCKSKGVTGYGRMNKAQLIEAALR